MMGPKQAGRSLGAGPSKKDSGRGGARSGKTITPAGAVSTGDAPTVVEALRRAEEYLRKHGVESPRLSAEALLAKSLSCSRLDLYLRYDERLVTSVLALYREDLRKRATRYPLQYLLGKVGFYSLSFRVREGVFIPRPETELLVEWIEEILGDREELRFLEFGVGAGVISGALAARHPLWRGAAFDVSLPAAVLAKENFEDLGVADRVSTFVSDGFGAVGACPAFDLLAANPPYIPSGAIGNLQDEVSKYEERAAIDGGERGLDYYPLLADWGLKVLRPGALLALEIGDGQAGEVGEMLKGAGYVGFEFRADYNGFERMVTARMPSDGEDS